MSENHEIEEGLRVAVATMQALLGLISPEIKTVFVDVSDDGVLLSIVVSVVLPELEDDIHAMLVDLESFLQPDLPRSIDYRIITGSPTIWELRKPNRYFIYHAKL